MKVRWTQSSRRHHVGRAHALFVMNTTAADPVLTSSGDEALLWVGDDDRGIPLEVIAIVAPGPVHIVIHVMPIEFRR